MRRTREQPIGRCLNGLMFSCLLSLVGSYAAGSAAESYDPAWGGELNWAAE